ncbi:putative membrane protein YeaQ/YmgE (transglycosylase-associated protein family) [Psychromicrobium silvestre]|uniref:Putative membrane protein YeaQ/YmgE (Transglycosylase-associated protein family) n=1 Tax=Psychromicrobium silvestre TaxID=1645614 RepID=A0A7Y9LU03_9MICC|nr:hypothetical protein [Psychromicrobium silvestre]NYE95590.1 putative membrane protein YeaQ/YmgE (transglycosylase-associated protein family) [Psychromicrobium silvestre]
MSETQETTAVSQVSAKAAEPTATGKPQQQPARAVLGPFSLRDLVAIAAVIVIFIGTLIPLVRPGIGNFWTTSALFFLAVGILLPLVVLGLLVARRVNPTGKLVIGTLTVDQFGSVVASFAVAYFFLQVVTGAGSLVGMVIALIGALVLLAATVLARWIPAFGEVTAPVQAAPAAQVAPAVQAAPATTPEPAAAEAPVDVAGSTFVDPLTQAAGTAGATGAAVAPEVASEPPTDSEPEAAAESQPAAEPVAESVDEPVVEPAAEPEVAAELEAAASAPEAAKEFESPAEPEPQPEVAAAPEAEEPASSAPVEAKEPESFAATVDPASRPNQNTAGELVQEAFWFAVDKPKAVVDEHSGAFLYNIEPGSWFLALQDRGYDYVVQSPEGKVGLLRDLRNIERAPQDG